METNGVSWIGKQLIVQDLQTRGGGEGGGGGRHLDPEIGGAGPRPQFGLKIRRGPGPPGLSPGSATGEYGNVFFTASLICTVP